MPKSPSPRFFRPLATKSCEAVQPLAAGVTKGSVGPRASDGLEAMRGSLVGLPEQKSWEICTEASYGSLKTVTEQHFLATR